jgi:hypothetical protein
MTRKKAFYCTYDEIWTPALTTRDRIEGMERELRGLCDQLAWNIEYTKRLQQAIAEKQEALDLEVAELLRQK